MTKLPAGWETVSFAELGGTVGGKTPSKSIVDYWKNGTVPWVSPKDMKVFDIEGSEDRITDAAVVGAGMNVLPSGSVLLVTRSGILAHTLPVAVTKVPVTINQDIKAIPPVPGGHCTRYVAYGLRALESRILNDCTKSGTTVASVELPLLEQMEFPLAPLREQQRIADKLDTVLARVDACRDRLARVAPLLKRFRQSVLAAATSGRLTEDWRSTRKTLDCGANLIKSDAAAKSALLSRDVGLAKKKSSANSEIDDSYTFPLPESWAFTSWGKLSEWITYGFTRPMPATSKGVKLLTAKNVHPFELRTEDCGFTSDVAFSELSEKDKPHLGDLLITKDGTIGRAAVVRSNEPFCINQSVAVCWLRSTTMNRRFLEIVANVDYTQRFVMEKAKGMAIQHLSITDFAQCPVPVPPLAEQDEIVRRVGTLFAFADRLETRLAQAQTAVDRLTPSLLAKAFRGELVSQDPKDEPAIELLRRLQADRPAGKSAKRRRAAA